MLGASSYHWTALFGTVAALFGPFDPSTPTFERQDETAFAFEQPWQGPQGAAGFLHGGGDAGFAESDRDSALDDDSDRRRADAGPARSEVDMSEGGDCAVAPSLGSGLATLLWPVLVLLGRRRMLT